MKEPSGHKIVKEREAVQKKPEEESSKGKTGPRTDTTRVAKERDKWRGEARLS